ncbi:MAG TPA: MATE family efflux transporter [Vicinamibacterales bacterium]|nr:MATE family efflux transporter [Vicinamibacterales bacterium]
MTTTIRAELAPMLRLALPVVLAELGWMSMGIVDTLMVAPLGPAAIGAVGIGTAMHMAFSVFGMGLLLGLDTLVSQAYGAGDHRDCHRWMVHGLALGAALSLPIMAACLGVLVAIPHAGFHPEVARLLDGYFSIVLWSTLPLLIYAALRRYLQGMHAAAPIAIALVTANLVNVAANWALIQGRLGLPALGVNGAAWATVVSRLYMLSVLWIAVRHYDRARASGLADVSRRLSRARLVRLWRLGFPAASQVTLEVGVFGLATVLAGRLDPVSSASHQIALNIAGASFMVPLGVASAGAVRVGNRVGARDPAGAARAGWTAIVLGAGFMSAMALVFLLIPRTLIALFSPGPHVVTLGASLLVIAAVFQLFDGLQAVATGALRGLGDTRMAMLVNLAGHWFVGLPVAYVLCFTLGLGVWGLWMGLSTGLIVCGVALTWYWRRRITHYQATGRLR